MTAGRGARQKACGRALRRGATRAVGSNKAKNNNRPRPALQRPSPADLASLHPSLPPSPGLAAARHVCLRTQVSLVFPWPPHPAATPFLFSVRLPACDSLVPPRPRWRPRTSPTPALLASRPPTFPTPASALHPRTRIPRTHATTAAPPPSIATPPQSATATSLLALVLASPRPGLPSMSAR